MCFQIQSTKPDNFTPRIVEKTDDYVYVEYLSPFLGVSVWPFLLSSQVGCPE
jgi:hypothetical protein